jgi:hypothetical protein
MKPIGSLTDENRMFITILQDIKSIDFVHVKPQMCIISSEGSAQGLSSLVIDSLFEIKCTSSHNIRCTDLAQYSTRKEWRTGVVHHKLHML